MDPRRSRFQRPPNPVHDQLREVRRGLLRLHKALIDSERAVVESRSGPMTNAQFLQALLTDPYFAWLRPFSGLIAAIDEALSGDEPVTAGSARTYVEQALGLVTPPIDEGADSRYEQVRRRDPAVLFAHVELSRRIAEARDIGPAAA